MADSLEGDHHATCEELSKATGANALEENAQEPTSFANGCATDSP